MQMMTNSNKYICVLYSLYSDSRVAHCGKVCRRKSKQVRTSCRYQRLQCTITPVDVKARADVYMYALSLSANGKKTTVELIWDSTHDT
jgi:hypothetical protein